MLYTRENLLYIPPGIAALSLVFLSFKLVWEISFNQGEVHEGAKGCSNRYGLLQKYDGAAILVFRMLRLLTILALLGLDVLELSTGDGSNARVIQILFLVCFLPSSPTHISPLIS